MCHRTDSSNHASKHSSRTVVGYANGCLDPVEGSVPKGSISKYLVSHDLSPDDWVRGLKPGDALKFVELLDEVLLLPLHLSSESNGE